MEIKVKKDTFPPSHSYEKDGWKMSVVCVGTYNEFVPGVAQSGAPKGSVSLEGHGVKITIGNSRGKCACCGTIVTELPINLRKSDNIVYGLHGRLLDEHNVTMRIFDLSFLCMMALKPYDPQSTGDFYFKNNELVVPTYTPPQLT